MNLTQKNKVARTASIAALFPAIWVAVQYEFWWIAAVPLLVFLAFYAWDQPRHLFALLWISIPFSFEFSFSPTLGTDLPDEPLMLLVAFLALFQWIYRKKALSFDFSDHPLFIIFLLWLGWMTLTTFLSTTPWLSFKFMLAKSWYTGAFFLGPMIWIRTRNELEQLLRWLYIPLLLLAALSMIRHGFNAFSFATASAVIQPYFRNHVVYSALLVTLVPVLFFSDLKKTNRSWCWVILIVVLAALFFSYARGAWLALLAGAAAYVLIRKRLLTYGYVALLLIGVLTLVWLKQHDRYLQYAPDYRTTIFHSDFNAHWRATYAGKDVSTAERFYRWIAGVRMVEHRPITGFGPSSFYSSYRSFTIPAYKTWVSNNPERSTVHNYFLLTAAEQGLPGLFIFLLLFGAILFYAERIYHRESDRWMKQVAAGVGIVAVMLGVVNFWSDLIETDKIGSLFFLIIALLLLLERQSTFRGTTNVERIP